MNFTGYFIVISLVVLFFTVHADDKDVFLEMHNNLRAQIANGKVKGQPPAADMVKMEWDEEIARHAERWASNCKAGHDSYGERKTDKFRYVGQNWAGTGDIKHGMQMWFDEYQDYNLDSQKCTGVCGHYTQIAWSKSTHVGCAYTKCPSPYRYGLSIVCNYGPAGNFNGQKPYKKGEACSACPAGYDHCVNGLCSKSPGDDKNGGKDKDGGDNKDKDKNGGDKKEKKEKKEKKKKGGKRDRKCAEQVFTAKSFDDCGEQYNQCVQKVAKAMGYGRK